MTPPRTSHRQAVDRWRLVSLIAPIGVLCVALFASWKFHETEKAAIEATIQSNFDTRVREISDIFKERLNTCEQVLHATVGLFASSAQTTNEEFRTFASYLSVQRVPGLQGVGLIRAPRADGSDGESKSVLLHFEPPNRNLAIPGVDHFSEPSRKPAMMAARDSGTVSVSDKRRLPEENAKGIQAGYRMYLPLYRRGARTDSVEARRAALEGWVFAAFSMEGLLDNIQGERRDIAVEVFDGGDMADDTLLFDTHRDRVGGESELTLLRRAFAVEVGGYGWTVSAQALPTLATSLALENLRLRKAAGLAASVLAAWLTWVALRRRMRALQQEEARHEEERHQSLRQERQRLMQDMHDGLGSSLITALRIVEHGRFDQAEIAEVIRGCIDDLKLAIDSLDLGQTDLLLLIATLRFRLVPRLEAAGISLNWKVQDVPHLSWLTPQQSLHILRILQEAISNVIKHANATEISVATAVEGNRVVVIITDNGRGFDPAAAQQGSGRGLTNQRRRAEAIGAEVTWDTSKKGTRFALRLPL